MTNEVWFQVEFQSSLEEGHWIPLFGRWATVEGARENRRHLTEYKGKEKERLFPTRIVRIERTIKVME